MGDTTEAALVEAMARAYCHHDGECPCATPAECACWGSIADDMRAALAAIREAAGVDAEALELAANGMDLECARMQSIYWSAPASHRAAVCSSTAALLRALAGGEA